VVADGSDRGGRRLVVAALLAWLPFAAAVVVLSALVYGTVQQSLRSGANDPQLQIAGDLAAQLNGGAVAGSLLGTSKVDLATSLSPYAIVFDGAGHPVASTGVLDGDVPVPPPGVLHAARAHRTELTWQPRDGVRSAVVVVPFQGSAGAGTVLVGRSLSEVEKRETFLVYATAAGLVGGLGATAAACLFAAWLRRRLSFAREG
jgi:hypothetical protein